ncbi:hypothetical protein CYMTET_6423 [Cymbomonas tetramitiformis]|uniref:Uncharacterized protein n=1 Tax=Cymbomonas tetramitiformis TaxID=36881 RepID=A0AAE0GXK3_9CHLO|nr:hypothetical protein CYMTET_6423 [Cymbomonas tetramitiformis]
MLGAMKGAELTHLVDQHSSPKTDIQEEEMGVRIPEALSSCEGSAAGDPYSLAAGASSSIHETRCHQGAEGLTLRQLIRKSAFWHLALLSLQVMYIVQGVVHGFILYLQHDVGFSPLTASTLNLVLFAFSVVGKLLLGIFMDGAWRKHASICSWYGSCFTLISAKPAQCFGTRNLGALQNVFNFFQIIGGCLGTAVTGNLRTATGSYTASFSVFTGMAMMVCIHCYYLEIHTPRSHKWSSVRFDDV